MPYTRPMQRSTRPLVYFSYRLAGSREHAQRLAEALRAQNQVDVFADADILPASHWPTALQDALDRASAIIVLIDRDWLRYQDDWGRRRIDDPEDWVHKEVSQALNRIPNLLPVLVEDARMPPQKALPDELELLSERQATRLRLEFFDRDVKTILAWAAELASLGSGSGSGVQRSPATATRLRLERLAISGFRCFENLEIDFSRDSTLPGSWTCIVGLNGSGKTTILQAIALLMLGPGYARELGGERLQSMRRLNGGDSGKLQTRDEIGETVLQAWLRDGEDELYLELTLTSKGPLAFSGNSLSPQQAAVQRFWDNPDRPVVGYGASRNLSDSPDRWDGASDPVLAQISLFDPMARLVRAKKLLQHQSPTARRLFGQLVERVFGDEAVRVVDDGQVLRFESGGPLVRAHDLPDGFRSSVAWMAHLCARFSAIRPSAADLSDLSGLALIDEIDLHLHASLQRKIIPKLRAALPNVQFIVTSHSPLIISSFDRNELVLLDRQESDGVRQLDRQIFAFSTDEVYDWLMDTPPHSAALDQQLEQRSDPALLYQSPGCNEEQARERQERQLAILKEIGFEDGTEV
ncbi:MAG: AAA family ATPase [Thermoanaerobaculia bacterium]|nr:AAA family ATPase [Thermoanaerobaculia bacterium]